VAPTVNTNTNFNSRQNVTVTVGGGVTPGQVIVSWNRQ
jgi:plastocyanin domain-containing protein